MARKNYGPHEPRKTYRSTAVRQRAEILGLRVVVHDGYVVPMYDLFDGSGVKLASMAMGKTVWEVMDKIQASQTTIAADAGSGPSEDDGALDTLALQVSAIIEDQRLSNQIKKLIVEEQRKTNKLLERLLQVWGEAPGQEAAGG